MTQVITMITLSKHKTTARRNKPKNEWSIYRSGCYLMTLLVFHYKGCLVVIPCFPKTKSLHWRASTTPPCIYEALRSTFPSR